MSCHRIFGLRFGTSWNRLSEDVMWNIANGMKPRYPITGVAKSIRADALISRVLSRSKPNGICLSEQPIGRWGRAPESVDRWVQNPTISVSRRLNVKQIISRFGTRGTVLK